MAEFSANNHINESTGMTPFFADNGFHPRTGVEPLQAYQQGAGQKARLLTADSIVKLEVKTRSFLQEQLLWSQQEQAHWANKNCQPHPEYKVGDMVYVDARHFASKQDSKSLSIKNAGPWKIVGNIANKTYKLDIQQQMKEAGLTFIFHSWKLHLALSDLFPRQVLKPRPPVFVNSSDRSKAHKE